ncbi:MAG: acetate--CoA ligase [Ignavibacteriaceae bacterium]|nr:acetate--CoA ligase [Ignavibacteriaceae bacterium]
MANQTEIDKGESLRKQNTEEEFFGASNEFKEDAHFSSFSQYKNVYDFSMADKERFWSGEARELHWFNLWKEVKQGKAFNSKWFVGGKTNLSYNCLDRHLPTEKRNKAAIIWKSESGESKILTYQLLFTQVCKFANVLKKIGVQKGDYVIIYMGIIPEAVIAMLACSRIGAVHSVVFSDFSSHALAERINNLSCKYLITQDYVLKKGNQVNLKSKVDNALQNSTSVEKVVLFKRSKEELKIVSEKEIIWQNEIDKVSDDCQAVPLLSQHPLFSMFTNGPNGDLVNILHLTGGYMVQSYLTAKWIFDLKGNDIIWSVSDISWISGHTYSIYGPLLNGVTTFLYEGVPIYPEPDRYWQLISKYRINILYINPTTIRALLKLGSEWVFRHDISSLRLLGIKSETIKKDTWLWLYENVGKRKCPIVDTWLQAETGSIIISPLPGASEFKPGHTGCPFPGIEIDIVDLNGDPVKEGEGGYLIIKDSWPSMFTTAKEEKVETNLNCWKQFKGNYFTGDAAVREKYNLIKILGRVDDVIKSAGNRVGGSEIEKVLAAHPSVKEAAVVKRSDEIIENAIVAFVVLNNLDGTPLLKEELRNYISEKIGSMAKPDDLIFLTEMPRLMDGKTDRGLLREKAKEGLKELSGEEAEHQSILEKLREDYQKLYLE